MKRFSESSVRSSLLLCALMVVFLFPMVSFGSQAKGDLKSQAGQSETLIDINTADVNELSTLPGIGPKIAEQIISYRADHGPFKAVQDLENVKGIGTQKMAQLKAFVTVKTQE